MALYRFEIARCNSNGAGKKTEVFEVALESRMTVLDGLFRIQREQDGSLQFRCSCRVGMCGTCGMFINRTARLACRTRAESLGSNQIAVAPLPHFPVIKDLMVSMEPFFEQWKKVLPAFHPARSDSTELARIRPDSDSSRQSSDKRDCITCGACFTACGVTASSSRYLGPAAINKAFLRLMDPRDGAVEERLNILNDEYAGVWRCHTQFNCVAACPKGINLTDSIGRLKRALLAPGRFVRNKAQAGQITNG